MAHAIFISPTHRGVGMTSAILGLYHALRRENINVTYYNPINQLDAQHQTDDHLGELLTQVGCSIPVAPIPNLEVERLITDGQYQQLLERVLVDYEHASQDAQIVLIGGLPETVHQTYANDINNQIAKAIGADIILVTDTLNASVQQFEQRLEYAATNYGGTQSARVLGAIMNHVGKGASLSHDEILTASVFTENFRAIACVPYDVTLSYPRTQDVCDFLSAEVLHAGEIEQRRIGKTVLIARTIANGVKFLDSDTLILTPCDRDDVLMATTLAASSKNIAGLLLTGDTKPTPAVWALCEPLIQSSGLPVIRLKSGSWELTQRLDTFNRHIAPSDLPRIKRTMEHFADSCDMSWCESYINDNREKAMSPAAFKYAIVKRARTASKTIVLPEGDEPRTVEAANACVTRGIADCILLANPDSVKEVADKQGVSLVDNIRIIDPVSVRENYIERLVELRKHKGMTPGMAKEQLEDNVMLGTMMLEAGIADGLVSGAVHTTANTIRPPLQIIKTAPNTKLVSSVFFMCLPEQVVVYGDCAVNPDPNAEALAEIAIQSAQSAKQFGIDPRVAMISYSTGDSGTGEEVEKVKAATRIVRERMPDMLVDGPLQYDAAAIASVAAKKAPNSPVAGRANVFVFPDLNTGNTTYKAVQRSAGAISIGPMLQGMRVPVNDLSRGALVEDIIYTIAITAVQAV